MSNALDTGALGRIAGRVKPRADADADDPDKVTGDNSGDEPEAADDTPDPEAADDTPDPEATGDDEDHAEGEEDEEPAMRSAYRRGAAAANARAAAILTAASSAVVPSLAADLAFTRTHIATADAVAMMDAAAKDGGNTRGGAALADRMAAHKTGVKPAPAPQAKTEGGMAERIHAASMATIETRKAKRS